MPTYLLHVSRYCQIAGCCEFDEPARTCLDTPAVAIASWLRARSVRWWSRKNHRLPHIPDDPENADHILGHIGGTRLPRRSPNGVEPSTAWAELRTWRFWIDVRASHAEAPSAKGASAERPEAEGWG